MVEEQEARGDVEIRELFKPASYTQFPVRDLVALSNYNTDQRFHVLVSELEDWNRRVQEGKLTKNSQAEMYRNKFLFSSLKNLVLNGSKGSVNY